jgi:hypothetical protein
LDSTKVRAFLVYHIPPGSNYYNLTHRGALTFWADDFVGQFLDILATNHPKIIGSFCSHTHNDEFRLVFAHGMPASYIHISPSISPVHGNSPAYQVFTAATNGDILDYETVWLSGFRTPNETWQPEYAFTNLTKDGYNENTLARLFFDSEWKENRSKFSENYYFLGRQSSADNTELYWGTVKLNAPLPDR